MRRTILITIVSILVSAGLMFAEGSQEGAQEAPGVTEDEVRVGYTMPMSGPIGFIGNQTADATRAVFEKHNEQGGIHGRQLKLITYDSGMDVAQALANYRRLVLEDEVFAILFGFGSYIRPAYDFLADNGVPWIFPMAPPYDAMFPAREYLFSVFPTTATQMMTYATWLKQEDEYETVGAIYSDTASGKTGLDGLRTELDGSGIEIVAAEAMKIDSASAAVQVAKVQQADPELIMIMGFTMQPTALIVKELKKIGLDTQILVNMPVSNGLLIDLLADQDIEGMLGGYWGNVEYDPNMPELATPEMRETAETVLSAYPKYDTPEANVGGLVEHGRSVEILVEALRRAGPEPTREKLIEALESMDQYDTGKGSVVSFGPNRREGVAGGIILRVEDDTWVPHSDWIDVDLSE